MQTFLPYPDFKKSAKCLDMRRLCKQRLEALVIFGVLKSKDKNKAWANHPVTLMWKGYENALANYYNIIVEEWVKRGYKNNMVSLVCNEINVIYPPWFGNEKFHSSHRSNLLRKKLEYYKQFNWSEPDNLPYYWPTKENGK